MQQALKAFIELFSLSAMRYFVVAGIPFIVCYKLLNNWLSQSKIQDREAAKKDFIREILYSVQTTAILTVIGFTVLYTPVKNITRVYTSLSDYSIIWLLVSVALALVIHDTYFYWMHRLLHHPKIFNYTHLLHHKSTNPSPWASYSFHFFEAWTEGAALLVVVTILPMHPIAIGLFILSSFIINVYGHLGYEVAPLWLRKTIFFEIFNTSVHHNLHHSKFKGNYGLYLRFWDRVMGTEHPDYVKEFDRIQQNRLNAKIKQNVVSQAS
ncbi:MAG: sterol desaturase family protein [Mucilaginibacter sp.]|uniref:sterol desaturase family protein n=1 Tax=Mucilaginibacter sp. TaxID=1882438 RepID=UPI0032657883